MDETTIGIIGTIAVLALLFGVASYLQNRSKRKGNLFTGKPSMLGRVIAILIGFGFLGVTVMELLTQPVFHPVLGLIGAACLLYGFGINALMNTIQGGSSKQKSTDTKPE